MTKRILIVFFYLGVYWLMSNLTHRMRGFGMGLMYTDTAEIIKYIARESPLRDASIVLDGEIVELDGRPVAGSDFLLCGVFDAAAETVAVGIFRYAVKDFALQK